MRILIASGGTGGHLFPALAVSEEIERRWPAARVTLTTGPRAIERDVCASAGRDAVVLPILPAAEARRYPVQFVRSLLAARRRARHLIKEKQPDLVIGSGGFSMLPVVSAALRSRTQVVLLEQNAVPGRATRWYGRQAAAVCSSFDVMHPTLKGARVEVTGNPVRAAISELSKNSASANCTLLVLGGSQGARALNEGLAWIASHHPETLAPWRIIHQTGGEDSARTLSGVYERSGLQAEVRPFWSGMAGLYAQAGLAVARAGATTLAELACAGIPAVLVPYPHARDLHQHANARVYKDQGAAILVDQMPDAAATGERLRAALLSLANAATRTAMSQRMRGLARPDAATRVVNVIERLLAGSPRGPLADPAAPQE